MILSFLLYMGSQIIIIRHGETIESTKGILLGQMDGELSDNGRKEVKGLCGLLDKFSIKKIYSSDLGRAIATAGIIAYELNIKDTELNKVLRERSAGVFEGRSTDEVDWIEYEKVGLPHRRHKGGESFLDVEDRICPFVEDMLEFKENTLLICHSVVMRMIVKIVNKISFEDALGMDLDAKFLVLDGSRIKIQDWS